MSYIASNSFFLLFYNLWLLSPYISSLLEFFKIPKDFKMPLTLDIWYFFYNLILFWFLMKNVPHVNSISDIHQTQDQNLIEPKWNGPKDLRDEEVLLEILFCWRVNSKNKNNCLSSVLIHHFIILFLYFIFPFARSFHFWQHFLVSCCWMIIYIFHLYNIYNVGWNITL